MERQGQADGHSACIDENAALDFVQGRLAQDQVSAIDEHTDQCASCRVVIDEAVRAFRDRSTGIERPLVPAVTRFSPGDRLAERYRILRFIARGGMGEVYEAHDLILSTRIALKTVAATISDDPAATRRLKQEVNLARRITHPNVCRIFDIGVHQPGPERPGPGVLFITMELVAGVSLGQRVHDDGRLTTEAALPIVQAMVDAVAAAHRAGVVHRDLKTDNVMLAPGEPGGPRVVVMDFGLARGMALSGDSSSMGGRTIEGTLAYMAPEQLVGRGVGPAADIYALGVVMFEILTGQLPFKGDPPLAAALKRLSEPAPRMRSLIPEIDPRWDELVARCLEREVEDRPASVEVVGRVLSGATSGHAAEPLSPSGDGVTFSGQVQPARTRRTWLRAGALGSGLALCGVLLVTGVMRLRSSSGHAPGASSAGPAPQEKAARADSAGAATARAAPPQTEADRGLDREPNGGSTAESGAATERGRGATPDAAGGGGLASAASRRTHVGSDGAPQRGTRRAPARRPAPSETGARGRTKPVEAVSPPADGAALQEEPAAGPPVRPRPRRSADPDDGFILK